MIIFFTGCKLPILPPPAANNTTPVTPPSVTLPPTTQPPVTVAPVPVVTPPTANVTPPLLPEQGPYDIWIVGHEFKPSVLTIPVGTTITFTNKDGDFHTITADGYIFDAGVSFLQTYRYTFTKAGVYNYHCSPHPDMTGVITVQ